mmetsp:Transcript_27808/g.20858  ORF Transcript_27808/g.20858 Transcript_27808/m.20858 type:complete len:104 (-) Transcript_27808:80-391(-)
MDVAEHINVTKVIDILTVKDKELTYLKTSESNFQARLDHLTEQFSKEKKILEQKLASEAQLKNSAAEKVSELRGELKNYEGGEGSFQAAQKWKNKFKDLFEIC